MLRIAVAILVVGCGRYSFAPIDSSSGDARRGDSSSADAYRLCATWGPFGGLVHAPELSSTASDRSLAVSPDNLTATFASLRTPSAGSYDLHVATRTNASLPFGAPVPLTEINSASSDAAGTMTPDGTEIYFGTNRNTSLRIWMATRADAGQSFDPPVELPGIVNAGGATEPDLMPDLLTMYFQRVSDIWVATRVDRSASWDTAAKVDSVSSTGTAEFGPRISADGLELFIASDRSGSTNIMVASRASISDPFGDPVDVPALATTTFSEADPEISDDGLTLWASILNGPSGLGSNDFYYVTRSCLD